LKKFLFLVTAAILNGGQSEQKVTPLDKDLARNISFMTIFNSIFHVVSEKKIIKHFSQSEALMAPGSHAG
jgi:proline dehydrogenase